MIQDDLSLDGQPRRSWLADVMKVDRIWRDRRGLQLHQRFAVAGSVVMLVGMALISAWVSSEIEQSVTRNSAISTALYSESFIAPLSQELSADDTLSPATEERLRRAFSEPPLSDRIVSFKLWKPDGLIAFATDPSVIGRRFEPSESLQRAWTGKLDAAFDELQDEEDVGERRKGVPLLEVYNPIHSIITGEIIAVAEFYQNAAELERDLLAARLTSWLVVAAVMFIMYGLLFGIVRGGSRTIDRQHKQLSERFAELSRVSEQNDVLRRRIQAASLRSAEHNERYMRRISAELHDGPAQALALASLRLDSLTRGHKAAGSDDEVDVIRHSLDEALRDVRDLCSGLTLPAIDGKSITEVLEMATEAHARRTGTEVVLDCERSDLHPPHSTLICLYRFVQEGLMNAFRHAKGVGQRVGCKIDGAELILTVSDNGPGIRETDRTDGDGGLGLRGLRERVESIGGDFNVQSSPERGTRLAMRVALESEHQ